MKSGICRWRRARRDTRQRIGRERLVLVLGWVGGLELPRQCVETRRDKGVRQTRLQPARQQQRVVRAILEALATVAKLIGNNRVVDTERQIHIGRHQRHRSCKALGRDPNDREVSGVDADRLPDECRIELRLLPCGIRRNGDGKIGTGTFFLGGEGASGCQPDAERVEVVRRNQRGQCPPGFVSGHRADHREGMRHQAVEHVALIANLCVVRIGEGTKRVRLRPIVTVGADKLAGAARERPQEQLVDDAEDRGVGTNANGENEDRKEGKSWRLDKGAEGVGDVLPESCHRWGLRARSGDCSGILQRNRRAMTTTD